MPVVSLSGGNQQKVLIARCLMRNPSFAFVDEPTRGVDVGAKAEIYAILRRLANQGIGVLFASSEIKKPGHWQIAPSFSARDASRQSSRETNSRMPPFSLPLVLSSEQHQLRFPECPSHDHCSRYAAAF